MFSLIFRPPLDLSLWLFQSSSSIPLFINLDAVQSINSLGSIVSMLEGDKSNFPLLSLLTKALLIVPPNTFFRSSSIVLPPRFLTNCCIHLHDAFPDDIQRAQQIPAYHSTATRRKPSSKLHKLTQFPTRYNTN
jgi:hypothetical protein